MDGWSHPISVGDRFAKAGEPSRLVYVVVSTAEPVDVPPHVRLMAAGQSGTMLMSVSAMLDKSFWSPVS